MQKVKGHSVQKLEWKQTYGGACITSRANAVSKNEGYVYVTMRYDTIRQGYPAKMGETEKIGKTTTATN